jgi:hypothetical protein
VWALALKSFVGRSAAHGIVVGDRDGRSSAWLLSHVLTDEAARLTCIEAAAVPVFREVTHPLRHKLRHIDEPCTPVLRDPWFPFGSADFIHLDAAGSARSVLENAVLGFRILKVEGVMVFDVAEPAPARAVERFVDVYGDHLRIWRQAGHVSIRKRRPRT